ncbi:MAG: hypothetical protein ACTSP4_12455 [Candidatus Hodarchaeales archaeon]
MKTKTTHCITLLVLLAMMLLPLISAASLPVDRPIKVINKTSSAVNTVDLNAQKYLFDFQNFGNMTVFNATKFISVNEWGYTIVNTTVTVMNNGTSTFNYFNITFPVDEWEQYDSSAVYPSEIQVEAPVMDSSNTSVTLAFQTPDITPNGTYSFSIVTGSGTIGFARPGVEQSDVNYPYRIKTNLLPWLSIPLNSLIIHVESTSGGTATFDEVNMEFGSSLTSNTPEQVTGSHYKLLLESLDTVDIDELNGLGAGNYNSSSLADQGITTFIPAYHSKIRQNMTSELIADYRDSL